MSNAHDSRTLAGLPGQPNAFVHLFRKSTTTPIQWSDVAVEVIVAVDGPEHDRDDFLNSPSDLLDREGPLADTQHCKVFEFRTTIPPGSGSEDLTLARCHELRTSPAVRAIEKQYDVEVILQPVSLYRLHRTPGLAVFDMDSTLIQQEVIDELARSVGRYDRVSAVTEAAMRGELDFEASLRARVAELKGVSTGIWEELKRDVITFTPGARELVLFLRKRGWKTAVLSGGFTPLAYWVRETLGLDYAFANQLAVDEGEKVLTGELLPGAPIVGAALKRELLVKLAAENEIPIAQTIAVGDGSNDLLMMGAAGLGIAFNAKPKVQEAAPARMNGETLLDVAYVLGFSKEEIAETLGEDKP